MASCRFMYDNFIADPAQLAVSSALPGLVGTPAPKALGAAICYADGEHSGDQDQVFSLEIDSVAAGSEVGQASFRWRRASAAGWEASGVATTDSLMDLADGVRVKWVTGEGPDFYLGDAWSLLAVGRQGPAALLDRDRDTAWRATGRAAEWLSADLGAARQVQALVLADHNLGGQAAATLKADDGPDWQDPAFSQALSITRPHLVWFLEQSYRHWRLELADPDNPQGLLRASLFYLGGFFQPSRTFQARYGRATVAGRRLTASDAGKLAGSSQGLAQGLSLSFPRLGGADVAGFEAMLAAVHQPSAGLISPLFFTPFADDPADTIYCLPGPELNRQQGPGGRWDLGLSLEEVVRTDV
ncbi:MAG: discoidin domain-containing protein [Desulfarculus sp.]|nr:MAG: discoidin domain-containing protein [Desulfarculus sp.]